jgi:hypothetical protein
VDDDVFQNDTFHSQYSPRADEGEVTAGIYVCKYFKPGMTSVSKTAEMVQSV